MRTTTFLTRMLLLGLLSMPVASTVAAPAATTEKVPLKQGLHEWPAFGGKLFLVVGTYQDTTNFRRTYNFFLKAPGDEAWNQVPVVAKRGKQFTWESAVGGEVTLADGTVVHRRDGTYFIVADKQVQRSYVDKGTITATWYKLTEAGDDEPDELAYQLKPVFTRTYPHSKQTVEDILAKEVGLQPRK